jgi:hypothetical protein
MALFHVKKMLASSLAILASPERTVGIKVVCEKGIAIAIADEQNAFIPKLFQKLATWLDLTLTKH